MILRTRVALFVLLAAGQAWSQRLPDFDSRKTLANERARNVVKQRSANTSAYARSAPSGVRVTEGPNGLPKIIRRDGGYLTAASTLSAELIAREYLKSQRALFGLSDQEVDTMSLLVNDVTPEATYLTFNQTVAGVDVHNAQIKFTLTPKGEITQVASGDLFPQSSLANASRLGHAEAVRAAYRGASVPVPATLSARTTSPRKSAFANPGGAQLSPITSEQIVFPLDAVT